MMQKLMESIKRARENQSKYPEGSENWLFYQRDIDHMEDEASKMELDERYALRSWP